MTMKSLFSCAVEKGPSQGLRDLLPRGGQGSSRLPAAPSSLLPRWGCGDLHLAHSFWSEMGRENELLPV